jgi:hypothetical protein
VQRVVAVAHLQRLTDHHGDDVRRIEASDLVQHRRGLRRVPRLVLQPLAHVDQNVLQRVPVAVLAEDERPARRERVLVVLLAKRVARHLGHGLLFRLLALEVDDAGDCAGVLGVGDAADILRRRFRRLIAARDERHSQN